MGTVNGTNYAKANDPTPGSNMLEASQWNGKLRVQLDEYEADGAADGTLIRVAKARKGWRLIDAHIFHDALGSGSKLAMQEEGGSADEIITAAATNAAGRLDMDGIGKVGHKFTADTAIVVEVEDAAATGTIKTAVIFAVE